MKLSMKKVVMSGVIALVVCFTAHALSPQTEPIWVPLINEPNAVIHTGSYDCNNTTYVYEFVVLPNEGYDTLIERCTDKKTGKSLCRETKLIHKNIKMKKLHPTEKMPSFSIPTLLEEGFCEGTLVKVPDGYMPIEDLQVGDAVIDMEGNVTKITAIAKRRVHEHVKIFLPDMEIRAGRDQRLYSASDFSWIKARDLSSESEHVSESINIYALSTGSHTLCVTPHDVAVHNGDALMLGASALSFAHISVTNPIVLLGGASAALAAVAYNAYQEYVKQNEGKGDSFFIIIPDAVAIADRFYYESRKKELESAKQELLKIKSDLGKITALCSAKFTSQFLPQYRYDSIKNVQALSIDQERNLSDQQKSQLREARENELALLEKQIKDIQLSLALHVNWLIENSKDAENAYNNALSRIEDAKKPWNSDLSAISYDTASKLYPYLLWEEDLLCDVSQATDELIAVINYYQACANAFIQDGTNIITVLDQLRPEVERRKQLITQDQEILCKNLAIVEDYFAKHGIISIYLKNEARKNLDPQKRVREIQLLRKAKTELVGSSFPSGPNKNNKKNDDDDKDSKEKSVEPDFIVEKRVPIDKETVLHDPSFKKTNIPTVKGAKVYSRGDYLYHRDTFHKGKGAHLEVYNKQGKHLGEADVFTGKLTPNTVDNTKYLII